MITRIARSDVVFGAWACVIVMVSPCVWGGFDVDWRLGAAGRRPRQSEACEVAAQAHHRH
jgi:hypothetical protein